MLTDAEYKVGHRVETGRVIEEEIPRETRCTRGYADDYTARCRMASTGWNKVIREPGRRSAFTLQQKASIARSGN